MGTCVRSLSSHTQSVTCVKWGGKNLIYSSSQDRTIKVWRSEDVNYFSLITYLQLIGLLELFTILGSLVSDIGRSRPLGKHTCAQ